MKTEHNFRFKEKSHEKRECNAIDRARVTSTCKYDWLCRDFNA